MPHRLPAMSDKTQHDRGSAAPAAAHAPDGQQRRPHVNMAESPLTALAARRDKNGAAFLDASQLRAGERLRADFERGRYMHRMGISWDHGVAVSGGSGRGPEDVTAAALDARRRVEAALAAVGPELAGLLLDVCCFLKGLEQVERERNWPVRSAKIVLRTGLAALSRHYEPQFVRHARPVVSWGAEDYRPTMVAPGITAPAGRQAG